MRMPARSIAGQYNAVVIGAGLGGATLAFQLARRGLRVLVVERGDYLNLPPREARDPIGVYLKSFPSRPLVVGGPTKFYGAAMYRLRERDFRKTVHESGESPEWPISYAELEPY